MSDFFSFGVLFLVIAGLVGFVPEPDAFLCIIATLVIGEAYSSRSAQLG